jgi:hypothetical protein
MSERVFLIPIKDDLRLQRLVSRPMEIYDVGDNGVSLVDVIPKSAIVCDACNDRVGVSEKEVAEEGLPVGYAVIQSDFIIEVVCEACRRKYFGNAEVLHDLEEAERRGYFK